MSQTLRDTLLCLLLGILCVCALKVLAVIDQAEAAVTELRTVTPVLVSTVSELRGAAREQRSYYKATGKALAISTIAFGRMVQATDRNLQPVLREATAALAETTRLAQEARSQVQASGTEAEAALVALRANLEALEPSQRAIERTLGNLEVASRSGPALAASAQKTGENVEASTAAIREMLNPRKVPFWRRILELIIPRPTVAVRR